MICWTTKLRIKIIALRDAKGSYGKFLIRRQIKLENAPTVIIDFKPSDWMKSLVNNYTNAVEKLVNDRKRIVALYAQMRQYHARLNESNNELNNKKSAILPVVSGIDAEIASIEVKITEISQLLSDFHKGEPLPDGLTSRKLQNSKAEFEQKISQLQTQRESASNISSVQIEHDKLIGELRDKVREIESDFSEQIDLLYRRIRKTELKYNEQIIYYWQELCKCIQKINLAKTNPFFRVQKDAKPAVNNYKSIRITEPVKQLEDIFPLCGKTYPTKEDLFKSERTFINTTINKDMGIQYEV